MLNSYITQIRMNLLLTLRNRMALFFSYIFPLIFFGAAGMGGGGGNPLQVVGMVLGLGVLGGGLMGVGMRAVQDRAQNILRRFKVAPIGPGEIIVSGMVTALASSVAEYHFHRRASPSISGSAVADAARLLAHLRQPWSIGIRFPRRYHRGIGQLLSGRYAADAAFLFPNAVSERNHDSDPGFSPLAPDRSAIYSCHAL